jgi:hypothetical protein
MDAEDGGGPVADDDCAEEGSEAQQKEEGTQVVLGKRPVAGVAEEAVWKHRGDHGSPELPIGHPILPDPGHGCDRALAHQSHQFFL